MKTIILKVDDNSYPEVIKAINDLTVSANGKIQIEESDINNIIFNENRILEVLKNKKINLFSKINDPIQWQKNQREGWD
ncbi:MAG: hypothetical protein WBK20_06645 [Spirochaetota bacterium]